MKKNNPFTRKKATKWEFVFIYAKSGISIIKGILIVPLYLKFIDLNIYGIWLATGNILAWLQVSDPGTGNVLKQQSSSLYGSNSKEDLGKVISSGWIISLCIGGLIIVFGFILAFLLKNILNITELTPSQFKVVRSAFIIAIIGTAFTIVNFSINAVNRGLLRTKSAGIISFVSNIIGVIVTIILLFNGFSIKAIAYQILTTGFLLLVLNLILHFSIIKKEQIHISFNVGFFKNFSTIFLYTFFAKLSNIIVEKTDLIIISRVIGDETVAVFELTRRPINIIMGLANRASLSLMPALANLQGSNMGNKFKEIFKQFIKYWFWLAFFICACFIMFNQALIPLWTGKEIVLNRTVNIFLCLGILVRSYTYNLSNFTYSYGNIKGNSIIQFIRSFCYIGLMLVLVSSFKLLGLVIAVLLTYLLVEGIYYTKKIIEITSINKKEVVFILKKAIIPITFLMISFLYIKYINIHTWQQLILHGALAFIIYCLLFLVINKDSVTKLINLKK